MVLIIAQSDHDWTIDLPNLRARHTSGLTGNLVREGKGKYFFQADEGRKHYLEERSAAPVSPVGLESGWSRAQRFFPKPVWYKTPAKIAAKRLEFTGQNLGDAL
jgi:hypothetical protein